MLKISWNRCHCMLGIHRLPWPSEPADPGKGLSLLNCLWLLNGLVDLCRLALVLTINFNTLSKGAPCWALHSGLLLTNMVRGNPNQMVFPEHCVHSICGVRKLTMFFIHQNTYIFARGLNEYIACKPWCKCVASALLVPFKTPPKGRQYHDRLIELCGSEMIEGKVFSMPLPPLPTMAYLRFIKEHVYTISWQGVLEPS